ncbi:hypothetical protein BLOT_005871 [Blomia tropicalis]|nr:hypothetical protein BLOT_005871 [Blomia tropicalis]
MDRNNRRCHPFEQNTATTFTPLATTFDRHSMSMRGRPKNILTTQPTNARLNYINFFPGFQFKWCQNRKGD